MRKFCVEGSARTEDAFNVLYELEDQMSDDFDQSKTPIRVIITTQDYCSGVNFFQRCFVVVTYEIPSMIDLE